MLVARRGVVDVGTFASLWLLTASVARVIVRPPTELLDSSRFDVYVEWACARAFMQSGSEEAPDFVKAVYAEHARALNRLHEPCLPRDRERGGATCAAEVRKSPPVEAAGDFFQTLRSTLQSHRASGALTNHEQQPIPVCDLSSHAAHVTGAAHGLALALALRARGVATRDDAACAHRRDMSAAALQANGFHSMYADWVMTQAIAAAPGYHVVHLWSKGVVNPSGQLFDLVPVRKLIARECSVDGGILYEKRVVLSNLALLALQRHAYGEMGWLPAKLRLSLVKGRPNYVVAIVLRSNQVTVTKCKPVLRQYYMEEFKYHYDAHAMAQPGMFYAPLHITDNQPEAVVASQLLFNENSLAYLQHSMRNATELNLLDPRVLNSGRACVRLAREMSADLKLVGAPPKRVDAAQHNRLMAHGSMPLHILPEGFLVSTRTAMELLELRPQRGKAVDLIVSSRAILRSGVGRLLRKCNGTAAHWKWCKHVYSSDYSDGRAEGASGARRASVTSSFQPADLVHDPTRHAYSWGLKFVVPVQMAAFLRWRLATPKVSVQDRRDMALLSTWRRSSCSPGERNGFCCADLDSKDSECREEHRDERQFLRAHSEEEARRRVTCRVSRCFQDAAARRRLRSAQSEGDAAIRMAMWPIDR